MQLIKAWANLLERRGALERASSALERTRSEGPYTTPARARGDDARSPVREDSVPATPSGRPALRIHLRGTGPRQPQLTEGMEGGRTRACVAVSKHTTADEA